MGNIIFAGKRNFDKHFYLKLILTLSSNSMQRESCFSHSLHSNSLMGGA